MSGLLLIALRRSYPRLSRYLTDCEKMAQHSVCYCGCREEMRKHSRRRCQSLRTQMSVPESSATIPSVSFGLAYIYLQSLGVFSAETK
mmetsp:Transcript_57716/g.130918  ORF Transcript_57716/g.130918 Transcript_57716/m.130918 type:complete len:88 (-) Transcript_57716:210-473(-)